MKHVKTRVARIRYNLEFSGYEAIVFVQDGGEAFNYPSFVAAPLDADYKLVMKSLAETALRKHRMARPGLRSYQRRVTPAHYASEHPPLAA